jgi:CHAT domain-containing protein
MTWFSRTGWGRSARRAGAAGALGLAGILTLGHGPLASAQQQAPNAEAAASKAEQARLADTDTLLALTSEGAVLYGQDAVKLSGYQYCSQAVALAEAGEFRQSVRAASKALHLANATRDPNLMAMANRDLAIVYSYSGQLDKAEEFAREALRHPARDPKLVVGPVQKVIGDVRTRRGDYAGAVLSYDEALANSSPRYAPLVQASLVNALIESGDAARARDMLGSMAPPKDAPLTAQLDRTRARLLLAENKPAEARDMYRALTARQVGTDTEYYRLWAWDGVARSELALGQKQAAAEAMARALGGVDQVRAKFRSEEFKMGLFSDLQSVFERGVSIYSDAGDARQAFEVSERSRSRALLDAVRGRAKISDRAASTVDLATLQGALAPDERVVQFHSLPDRLLAWVVSPTGIEAHTVAVRREELTELVEVFRNSIVRGRRAALTNGDKLGAALLGPLGLASGQRMIVVPHGPLHYLPFQALRLNGRYVIEQHPVAVAPSISIAVQLAQRTPRVSASLTAFGNPRIEDKYDLPGAEIEVKQLAQLFPRNTVYMGAAATKTQFREVSGPCRGRRGRPAVLAHPAGQRRRQAELPGGARDPRPADGRHRAGHALGLRVGARAHRAGRRGAGLHAFLSIRRQFEPDRFAVARVGRRDRGAHGHALRRAVEGPRHPEGHAGRATGGAEGSQDVASLLLGAVQPDRQLAPHGRELT